MLFLIQCLALATILRPVTTLVPHRSEEELDPVSLHNTALMHMEVCTPCRLTLGSDLNIALSLPPLPPDQTTPHHITPHQTTPHSPYSPNQATHLPPDGAGRGLQEAQLPDLQSALPSGDLRQPDAAILQAPVLRPCRRRPRRERSPHFPVPLAGAVRFSRRDADGAGDRQSGARAYS
jgi:hypothetical protein